MVVQRGSDNREIGLWGKKEILKLAKTITLVSTLLAKTFPSFAQNSHNKLPMNHQTEYTQMHKDEFMNFLASYVDCVETQRVNDVTIYKISDFVEGSNTENMDLSIHMVTKFERCPSKKGLQEWETIYQPTESWREIDFITYDQVEIFKLTYQYTNNDGIIMDVIELYSDHLVPLAKLHTWTQDNILKKTVHLFDKNMECYNQIIVLFALNMLPKELSNCIKEGKKQEKEGRVTRTFELDQRLRED